jgi:predicted enzyme related to lactoylglutathione lyase
MASSGKLVHIELLASDADRAQRFYSELFGWQFADSGMEGIDYRMFQGEPGGAVYPGENAGQGPIVYFETDDIDAEVAKARELGGQADDKQPIPGVGWFAGCKDPDGNSFSFFQSDESVPPPSA